MTEKACPHYLTVIDDAVLLVIPRSGAFEGVLLKGDKIIGCLLYCDGPGRKEIDVSSIDIECFAGKRAWIRQGPDDDTGTSVADALAGYKKFARDGFPLGGMDIINAYVNGLTEYQEGFRNAQANPEIRELDPRRNSLAPPEQEI